MFSHLSAHTGLLIVAAACVFLSGCGPYASIDLGNPAKTISATPRINNVEFEGNARAANSILVFRVDFDDDDADLEKGELIVTVVGREHDVSVFKLKPLFLLNEIAPGTKESFFRFPLEVDFADSNPGQSRFEVWLQLKDALGHTSNVAKVKLLAHFS